MLTYEYIDHVLANYLSPDTAESEEDTVSILRKHIMDSPALAIELRKELQLALNDSNYSWKQSMATYDVLFTETEEEAREYVRRVLWEPLFA